MDIAGLVLMSLGCFFFLGTAVGVLRFPDFYTRMHAAGKGDTLSTLLFLLGIISLAIYNAHHVDFALVVVVSKLIMICCFVYIGSPTATHALTNAAHQLNIKPWKRDDRKGTKS